MATLSIGDGVKGHALTGLYNNLYEIRLIDDTGATDNFINVDPANWEVTFAEATANLIQKQDVTIDVTVGAIIQSIELRFAAIGPYAVGASEVFIVEDVGGTGGESFPDGGSITITSWVIDMNG